ncbi:MAG: carboxypeptidase regulatory-like domain-containing protein, partial [Candidatus Cloacimonetes bacterium]|nr:carboxypeptidase regulatory-like domain-containing protein [Candidatus Cloacimonadota bacterium]
YLTITHDPVLLSGLDFFTVTADNGSLIALSVDGVLIGVGEGTGAPVNITIDPQLPPTMVDIVITKQDYYRYESQIQVIPPSGPYVVFNSYVIDDTATGNSNGVLDYGEQIDLDFSVNNVGSDEATNVVVNISTTDSYVTIFDGTENFGNIPAGTIVTVNGAFSIGVDYDIPDGHLIIFEVEAIGQATWISLFSIDAHAPILEFVEFLVDDTASGNGDYLWDPGETVDIIVTVENCGTSDAFNVLGELTTSDPYVTLNTIGPQSYGDVSFGISADAAFNATSATNTPEAHLASFNIDFTADNGITGSGSFNTQIGGYLIEEYFDTFPPAGWTTTGGSNWGGNNSSNAGGTAPEARFYWSPSTTAVQRLISLPVNTTGSSALELEFKHSIDHFSGAYDIRLETTSDGITWNIVQSWPAANLPATTENIIIDNDDVGSSTFQLAFVFDGYSWNINYWYVDDVILGGGQSAQTGTVSGTVTDIITAQPIVGADIAGMTVSGADGSYTFDIAIGTYDFTCTANGYEDLTVEDVEVLESQTTTVDFAMNPMLPPENLTIEIVTFNDVLLNWEAPGSVLEERNDNTNKSHKLSERLTDNSVRKEVATDNTRDLLGYKIYKDGAEIVYIDDPGILTYTDTGVEPGVHEYGITAVYDGGESDLLTVNIEIILPIPQNVVATFNYPDVTVTWDPISDGRDFVSYGVYRDGVEIATGVTNTMFFDPNLPSGNYCFNITAWYDGPWESDWSDDAVVEVTESNNILIPVRTELAGNYPNPFNPTTTIKFGLKETCEVSIKVYNIKGSVVSTLVDGQRNAAYHEVVWDGKDNAGRTVSSGLYFYKMVSEGNSGRYTSTKKMILLK